MPNSKPIHVAIGVLTNGDHKILLTCRPEGKPYAGYWEFPGGKIEAGESIEQALKRELEEELGISVLATKPMVQYPYEYPNLSTLLDVWWVTEYQGQPHGREGQTLGWFSMQEIDQLLILPGSQPILDRLDFE